MMKHVEETQERAEYQWFFVTQTDITLQDLKDLGDSDFAHDLRYAYLRCHYPELCAAFEDEEVAYVLETGRTARITWFLVDLINDRQREDDGPFFASDIYKLPYDAKDEGIGKELRHYLVGILYNGYLFRDIRASMEEFPEYVEFLKRNEKSGEASEKSS